MVVVNGVTRRVQTFVPKDIPNFSTNKPHMGPTLTLITVEDHLKMEDRQVSKMVVSSTTETLFPTIYSCSRSTTVTSVLKSVIQSVEQNTCTNTCIKDPTGSCIKPKKEKNHSITNQIIRDREVRPEMR